MSEHTTSPGATSPGAAAPGVTLSARAAARIAQIMAGEAPGAMLRVSVSSGGCSGFQYGFDIVAPEDKAEDDLVVERGEATVLIDPVSLDYMAGAEIDYVDDLIGAAFKVNNPLASAGCGCGTSFSI